MGPDADGLWWWCLSCSGLLGSRSFPKTVRRSRLVRLVDVDTQCCRSDPHGDPGRTALVAVITFGKTAWRISLARRQVLGSANSALKAPLPT